VQLAHLENPFSANRKLQKPSRIFFFKDIDLFASSFTVVLNLNIQRILLNALSL